MTNIPWRWHRHSSSSKDPVSVSCFYFLGCKHTSNCNRLIFCTSFRPEVVQSAYHRERDFFHHDLQQSPDTQCNLNCTEYTSTRANHTLVCTDFRNTFCFSWSSSGLRTGFPQLNHLHASKDCSFWSKNVLIQALCASFVGAMSWEHTRTVFDWIRSDGSME